MFKHGFPPEWSTFKKLIWLVGSGIAGASYIWKTVTGTLIHITDALASPMQKCEVALEPIQDLNGQDAPYPPGGGKNLVDPSACTLGKRLDNVGGLANASNWAVSDWIPCQPNTDYCARSVIPAANGYAYCFYDSNKTFLRYATISGTSNVATSGVRNSGADAAYLRLTFAKSDLENKAYCSQSSSIDNFSPYSNICPITGWTGAKVSNTGANLFDKSRFSLVNYSLVTDQSASNYGYYYGNIRNLGYNSNAFNRDNGGFLGFSANGRITFSCDLYNVGSRIYARFYYTDGTYSDGSNAESGFTGHYTATSSADKLCAYVTFGTSAGASAKLSIKNVQVQYGATETAYEEFGTTYPISWQTEAGTVYGGTVDLVSGVLTVEAELEVFNVLDGDRYITSQINYFDKLGSGSGVATVGDFTRISFGVRPVDQSDYNRISSSYAFKMCNLARHYFAYVDQSVHWYRNTLLYLFLPTALVGSTAESVYNYLVSIKDTTPLSFWIPYNEPIEIQLTPQPISTLAGENNVWSNSNGDTTITYKAQSS